MNHDEMRVLVDRWIAGWNRHDADAVAACYSEDAVWRGVGRALPGRPSILGGVQEYLEAFPDLVAGVSRVGCDGDVVYVEWHVSGTHSGTFLGVAASDRRVEIDGCNVLRVGDGGRFITENAYWDVASLLEQIGGPGAATA